MEEIWKQIPGHPRYLVSNKGRVKSFTSSRYPNGKILTTSVNEQGYKTLKLMTGTGRTGDNKVKIVFIHRLVAEAFIPIPKQLSRWGKKNLQVDHIIPLKNGGDILNADGTYNLRWVTAKGNAWNSLTTKNRNKAMAERMKFVYQYTNDLKLVATYPSTADAARQLNKSQGNIASCLNGSLPRYLGYIFSYVPLTDIKEREELEQKARPQYEKNKRSTALAVKKYAKKAQALGRLWYQKNPEKSAKRSREYYLKHKDEILKKMKLYRERKKAENARGSKTEATRILSKEQGTNTPT